MLRSLLIALFVMTPVFAQARSMLDRVRQEGVLHCAGVLRPGLAFPGADRAWHGLEVEICRAVAVAAGVPEARIAFHELYAPASLEGVRRGEYGVAFLTSQEITDNRLGGVVRPIGPVFNEPEQVMVPADEPARHVDELSGKMVCFEPGTRADRDLDALVSSRGVRPFYGPFFEAEEMLDAFNVGRCNAIVGEATALAALGFSIGKNKQPVRLLPEVLSLQPVLAVTPGALGDGWGAVVGSVLQALHGGKAERDGPAGLAPGWSTLVVAKVGTYDRLFRQTVGVDSPLGLPPSAGVEAFGR